MKRIDEKLNLLGITFYEELIKGNPDTKEWMERIVANGHSLEVAKRNAKWDWTHGVGLYGFWKLFDFSGDKKYLEILNKYYTERVAEGLPNKSINSTCPMLTLTFLYEHTGEEKYLQCIKEWSEWVMNDLQRTEEGGVQHITADSNNDGELWDDSLYMTVLFLAKAGKMLNNEEYIEEARYQFLVHIKYLTDRKTGLWFHGWTFKGRDNFAEVLWARGNSWITLAVPEFYEIIGWTGDATDRFIKEAYLSQVKSLKDLQHEDGLWHTVLNEKDSYLEASAACGFAAGILKGYRMGFLGEEYLEMTKKTFEPIMNLIDDKGILHKVSVGTAMGKTGSDFYKKIPIAPMPYGQSMAMLFLIEVLISKQVEEGNILCQYCKSAELNLA